MNTEVTELIAKGNFLEARKILYALEKTSNDPDVYYWIAKAQQFNNPFEAIRYCNKVLEIDDKHLNAIVLLHDIYLPLRNYTEMQKLRKRISELSPKDIPFLDRANALEALLHGDYVNGFKLYESRLSISGLNEPAKFKRWNKENLLNKKIVIRGEEGFGDHIQFIRFAQNLKDIGAEKIGFVCEHALHRLMLQTDFIDAVYKKIDEADDYDYEVMMLSLPYLLEITSFDKIPNKPYIHVKEEDRRWKKILENVSELKVGLVWSGDKRNNKYRAINFEQYRPFFDVNNCQFFSLQKGDGKNEILEFPIKKTMHDVMDYMSDFYDTACLVKELDLIITVDTSVAHLSASMGKPVWMISRYNGCWRWLTERSDSPWYPTVKIYRQETPENWNLVINQVYLDLQTKSKIS